MLLIVGLGNPGSNYTCTRHNAGFIFLDEFYNLLKNEQGTNVSAWELSAKFEAWIAEIRIAEKKIFLMKPNTFMNRSGSAVRSFMNWHKDVPSKQLIAVYDDLDLELGKMKIKFGIYPKSHNGVSSIVTHMNTPEFLNIRLGVDSRGGDRIIQGQDYVLQKMTEDELTLLKRASQDAIMKVRTDYEEYF
jgi:peptidyl-tRNA hydrolase, PTH1 family